MSVVEYTNQLRVNGIPIDIRGDAVETVARMGLLAKIREQRIRMSELLQFVAGDGEPVARIPMAEVSDSDDDIEIVREDLVRILADALPDSATIRFGDSVEALSDDGDGVDVGFRSGRTERYDLVLGVDGQHSAVRGPVFGPERDYLRHLGVYIALADLPGEAPPTAPARCTTSPAGCRGPARQPTPYNTGDMLAAALRIGAAKAGDWSTYHSVQWDAFVPDNESNRELTTA